MIARRKFDERETIATLIYCGVQIPCYRCKKPFFTVLDIEREHITELALGGKDMPSNCAYSHQDCHALITNGSKATSAGSSKHRIAKVRRLTNPKQKRKRAWQKTKWRMKA